MTNDQTRTRLNPVSFIHSPGRLSVARPGRSAARRGAGQMSPADVTLSNDKAARPQDTRGNQMELQLIIGAGIAASAIITALLLRWQDDPIEEQIREAMQYETKKTRTAKALRS